MSLWNDIIHKLRMPLLLILVLLACFELQIHFLTNPQKFAVHPLDFAQWWGIFTMPFVHGGAEHLFSNLLSFAGLGFLLYMLYFEVATKAMLLFWLFSGVFMFIGGRGQYYHLGASGVVYAMMAFLVTIGFLINGRPSKAAAITVILFYGSAVWGFLPINNGISWDGHVAGALAGVITAFLLRGKAKELYFTEPTLIESEEDEDTEKDEYSQFGQ